MTFEERCGHGRVHGICNSICADKAKQRIAMQSSHTVTTPDPAKLAHTSYSLGNATQRSDHEGRHFLVLEPRPGTAHAGSPWMTSAIISARAYTMDNRVSMHSQVQEGQVKAPIEISKDLATFEDINGKPRG